MSTDGAQPDHGGDAARVLTIDLEELSGQFHKYDIVFVDKFGQEWHRDEILHPRG